MIGQYEQCGRSDMKIAHHSFNWLHRGASLCFSVSFYKGGACTGHVQGDNCCVLSVKKGEAHGLLARCTLEKKADCKLRKPCALSLKVKETNPRKYIFAQGSRYGLITASCEEVFMPC